MSGLGLIAVALGVAALLGGAAILLAYRLGRVESQCADGHANEEVRDAQLQAAAQRPDTRDELAQRLRGDF